MICRGQAVRGILVVRQREKKREKMYGKMGLFF